VSIFLVHFSSFETSQASLICYKLQANIVDFVVVVYQHYYYFCAMITSFFAPKNGTKKACATNVTKRSHKVASEPNGSIGVEEGADNSFSRKRAKHQASAGISSSSDLSAEVQELLKHLTDHSNSDPYSDTSSDEKDGNSKDGSSVTACWKESLLKKSFSKPSFARLASFVQSERSRHTVYPAANHTWAALNACPMHKVKVCFCHAERQLEKAQRNLEWAISFFLLPLFAIGSNRLIDSYCFSSSECDLCCPE